MAYAAVASLKSTLQGLQKTRYYSTHNWEFIIKKTIEEINFLQCVLEILDERNIYRLSWDIKAWELVESQMLKRFPSQYPILQFVSKDIESLQEFFRSKLVDPSDGRIIEADSKLVEILHQYLLSSSKLELERVKQGIYSFIQTVEMINEEETLKKQDNQNKTKDTLLLHRAFSKTMDLIGGFEKYAKEIFVDLETTLRRFDKRRSIMSRERVDGLEVQIREAMCEFEDLLDTRVSDEFLNSQSESLITSKKPFPLNSHEVETYVLPFTQLVEKLKQDYMNELILSLLQENENDDDDDIVVSREFFSCENKCEVVGLNDVVVAIKDRLTDPFPFSEICTLFGMAGIGKTMVASKVFEDPSILDFFELRAWVHVGQNYRFKRTVQSIIAQLNLSYNIDELLTRGDKSMEGYLHKSLNGRRYLIVLDDVWDSSVLDDVRRFFPKENGGQVLLTSRLEKIARRGYSCTMRFLSNEESWDLLREKVFGKEPCPSFLRDSGIKIAESCDGLPLTIVTVAQLLSKVNKEPKKWNELAANPNPLLEEAYEQMLEVLLPSYNNLPRHVLKACFLYMGVFPRKYVISLSEITKLWAVDIVFNQPDRIGSFMIIDKLVRNSIIIPGQSSSSSVLKNWRLHSSFWHLCKKEAWKSKVFHAIECSSKNSSFQVLKSQRRLCIHNNVLLSIKDVHNSIASISTARAIHCTGPPHEYPVPICFGLKLLKILNALTIRLYEFPEEVLKLPLLKYLALTCYQNPPSSISKLRNLEFLIVRRHLSIISSEAPSFLPIEIWDMEELKHLQVMGSDLPDPCHDDTSLPNLKTLLDVSPHSCTEGVFKGFPNLKKLGIRIELAPHAAEVPSCCFDHISHLKKLKSLKCVVMNPSFSSEVDISPPPPPLSNFPSSLKKLSLSGFGYLWEDMRSIASLPNLMILKLRCYAFRGPKWEIQDKRFPVLQFLLIEDTDLANWIVGRGSLPKLRNIFLKSCYKLEIVPLTRNGYTHIELDNCNPLGVASAQLIYHTEVRSKSMLD